MEVAVAAEARLQPRPAAVEVRAPDVAVVDHRRLASAAAGRLSRQGHDRVAVMDRVRALARAEAIGSAEVARGVEPANSVAVMVLDRGSVGATERVDAMPGRALATAVESVARGSATGRDGASVMVDGATIVAMCAGTDAIIRGVQVFRSGSTMDTTMATASG